MSNSYDQSCSIRALEAAMVLHRELLDECCYGGYDGDKLAFDSLYSQVFAIVKFDLTEDADSEYIAETFHDYQLEIMNGQRDADWYMYL